MAYRSELAIRRAEEKKAKIAAVKALNIAVGDWVSLGLHRRIIRATKDILDPRKLDFVKLRRVTDEEIALHLAQLHKKDQELQERQAYLNREDVQLANSICWDSTQLIALGVEKLRIIDGWLKEAAQ